MKVSNCTEDWNKMNPNEIGKFCSTCQTSVYKIHNNSLHEIDELKTKNNEKICGRISKVQYEQFRFLHPMKRFAIALFLVFGTGLFTASYAQLKKEASSLQTPNYTSTIYIFAQNNKGEPMPYVNVSFTYKDDFIHGQTDSSGKLQLFFQTDQLLNQIGFNIDYKNTFAYIEKQVHTGANRLESIIYNADSGELIIGKQIFYEEFLLGEVILDEDWDQ